MNARDSTPPSVPPSDRPSKSSVDAFLDESRNVTARKSPDGRGSMIFALDATMSRQPTWDLAQSLQARMFDAAGAHGGLDVQLVYFRGISECKASRFVSQGRGLAQIMSRISCHSGMTQIGKVLRHARDETRGAPVGALVFVGDAMEEKAKELYALAGELGLLGVKAFMFHEGENPVPAQTFKEIARLTGGAYAAFDSSAPARLADLLAAAAAYASGGLAALEKSAREGGGAARFLLSQMR